MRQTSLNMVYEMAKNDPRIVFIGSDLGTGVLKKFQEEMPDRYFMEGISEAQVIGMAAGMAMEGKIPYLNTIATFLTRRCYEQVVLDVCLHNLNVRLIGSGGGVVYAPLGPTHQAIEDLAIFSAIPNMTIISPADAEEMKRLMALTPDYPGPIYIRLGKGGDPIVTPADRPVRIGAALPVQEGRDLLLVTSGITLGFARQAAAVLEKRGISVSVLHLHTVKPLDEEAVLDRARIVKAVITIEEGVVHGGLGGAIAELLAEELRPGSVGFKRIGINDQFLEQYGSQDTLLKHCGISVERIEHEALRLLG